MTGRSSQHAELFRSEGASQNSAAAMDDRLLGVGVGLGQTGVGAG